MKIKGRVSLHTLQVRVESLTEEDILGFALRNFGPNFESYVDLFLDPSKHVYYKHNTSVFSVVDNKFVVYINNSNKLRVFIPTFKNNKDIVQEFLWNLSPTEE